MTLRRPFVNIAGVFQELPPGDSLPGSSASARVTVLADATSISPSADTTDVATQANTQAAGTLTVNNPTFTTPVDEQRLALRLKCTNAQTLVFGSAFRGSNDLPLPLGTTGGAKTDRFLFAYNSADSKWDFIGRTFGY